MKKYIFFIILFLFTFSPLQLSQTVQNERSIKNFEAFTKLYGYIRFFHPSDEAQQVNWDKFAVYGMSKVENSANAEELKNILMELYQPVAPSLQIFNKGDIIDFDISGVSPKDTAGLKKVYWQHNGIYLGNKNNVYKSARVNTATELPDNGFGSVTQLLNAGEFKGKKIKIKAFVKADVKDNRGSGHLWLRVDLPNNKMGFFDNMDSRPITKNSWNEYEISGITADNAERIVFGCFLQGDGKLWVDEFRFYYEDNGKWKEVNIKDKDFETNKPGDTDLVWGKSYDNYEMSISETEKYSGNRSLMIKRINEKVLQEKIFELEPVGIEWLTKDLNDELSCMFPVSLYADRSGTLPHTDGSALKELNSNIDAFTGEELNADNKFVRLADICIAWNIFRHFYPYFDIAKTEWNPVLPEYLTRAYGEMKGIEFHGVLLELVAQLKDGHGRVSDLNNRMRYYPPIILDKAEDKIVVARIFDGKITGIEPGDEITEIDGEKISGKIDKLSSKISFAAPQWKTTRLLYEELVKGKENSIITLKILNKNGNESIVTLTRDRLADNIPNDEWYPEKRPEPLTELKKGIYYVNLDICEMNKIDSSMKLLADAKAVIFDLRGYPRGNHDILSHLTDTPLRSAFFSMPRIVYPDGEKWMDIDTSSRWFMEPLLPRIKGKVVFLTNGNAISYAESVMGIVEAYKLGTIIGEPTAGTNGNVNPFKLPGGYYVTWTGMNVRKHDGSQHHGIGILPDITVKRTVQGIREGRDEYIEKAIEFIEKQ